MPPTEEPKPPAAPVGEKGKKKPRKSKTRELVECLVVAGALALGIRTFAFQIFKIPTRSMEPMLIGNNDYGDRVVAAMWYKQAGWFRLPLAKPDRWQVIVFDHFDERGRPINYIKRLIGLPGEHLEIRDGDIWIDGKIARKPPGVQAQLWTLLCDQDFANLDHLKYWWTFRGLTADGGRAVMQPPGGGAEPAVLCWSTFDPDNPDKGRDIDNRFIRPTVKVVTCSAGHSFKAAFDTARPLAFCPRCGRVVWGVRNDGGEAELVSDVVHQSPASDYWTETGKGCLVPDLRLALDFEYLGGAGELKVTLVSRGEPFDFRLPLGSGDAAGELSSARPGVSGRMEMPVAVGRRHHLEVVNVDGAFWVELDDSKMEPCRYQVAERPGPADARVALSGTARLRLERVRLWRDIYYGFQAIRGNGSGNFKNWRVEPETKRFLVEGPLGPDQVFFLGDNQLASSDSRVFGPKREADVVARAMFVLWPASRWHLVW